MTQGQITDPKTALAFIHAGKATVTFRSLASGNRFTYKIVAAKKRNPNDAPTWFVKLLNGQDNNSSYVYIGTIRNNQFFWTGKSHVSKDASSFIGFQFCYSHLADSKIVGFEVWHEGKCGRCGKKLTVPESIASGFGPDCLGLAGLAAATAVVAASGRAVRGDLNFDGSIHQPKANGLSVEDSKFIAMKAFRDRNDDAGDAKFLALSQEAGFTVEDWQGFSERESKLNPGVPALAQSVTDLDSMIRARILTYKSECPENYYQDGELDEKDAFNVAYNKFRVQIERESK
jgi:Family of unknown function (DUF6011)